MARRRKYLRSSPGGRRFETREPYDRVLIVCEGGCTEPNYLKEICRSHSLSSANLKIYGQECGSDPRSVVEYSIEKFREEGDFDRLFCVIDRDGHANFQQAVNFAQGQRLRNTLGLAVAIEIICSTPCFEYWLLLHFTYTTAAFGGTGQGGGCAAVIRELDQEGRLLGYRKGAADIYERTKKLEDTAIENANRSWQAARVTNTTNPSTNFHDLFTYLKHLR